MANNNLVQQLYATLNTAAKEAFGKLAPTVKNAADFVSLGDFVLNSSSQDQKDAFSGALTNVIGKTVIAHRTYKTKDYPFLVDVMEYGSIYRKIKVFDADLIKNLEWEMDTVTDQFDYKPIVPSEYLFQKLGTWSKMISIPDFQLKTAFNSEAAMTAFYASMYDQLETAVNVGIESLNRLALASFIAEKIHLQTTQSTKIHAINVLAEYNTAMGTTLKADKVYTDRDFMKFFARLLKLYKPRLTKLSVSFNNTDLARHTPEEYQDLYMLADVTSGFAAYLESDTFHKELVSLPTYHDVPYWQAPGLSYAVEDTSKVNIKLASDPLTTIDESNILGVLMDREAIATYFQLDTTETVRDIRKKMTNQVRSATKGMMLDLGENGIVFYAKDQA